MHENKDTSKQIAEKSGHDFVLSPSQGRQKENMKAAIIGLFMNILLAALKMFIGVISGSIAILADGWNNLSDSFSSVMSIVSLAMASKPADKEHPFGHARFEYIASSVIAIGMLIVAVQLGYQSLLRTITPQPLKTDIWTLVALFASIGVKLFQFFFYRYRGKKIVSTVLLSAAQDSLADVWATSGVLVATAAYALWGLNIDGPAGLFVSLLIAWSAISIIREMVTLLIGSKPPAELTETIIERILETDRRILGVHDLIVHNYGPGRIHATAHVDLDSRESFLETHLIVDRIERKIKRDLDIELLVRADPANIQDEAYAEVLKQLEEVTASIAHGFDIHSFHLFHTEDGKLVASFDIHEKGPCALSDTEVFDLIHKKMHEHNENIILWITLDREYTRSVHYETVNSAVISEPE